MPSVSEETLGKAVVCRVPDIMHSANIKHSAFSLFPVVTLEPRGLEAKQGRATHYYCTLQAERKRLESAVVDGMTLTV